MNKLSLFILLAVIGCAVGPDYQKPQPNLPPGWQNTAASSAEEISRWWQRFNDPVLSELIDVAAAQNRDIAQMEARLRRARAVVTGATAPLYPELNLAGVLERSRSEVTSRSFNPALPDQPLAQSTALYRNLAQGGLDVAWELDIFGGIRREREASIAELELTEFEMAGVLISTAAEVAAQYVELRAIQEQLGVVERAVENRTRTVELTEKNFNGGFVTALDVATAKAELQNVSSRLAPLQARELEILYGINTLCGEVPGSRLEQLRNKGTIPARSQLLSLSAPAETIARRPDLRAREAQLHAATARVGAAISDTFPKVSLTGSFGYQRMDFSNSPRQDSQLWGFGPRVSIPIFNAGRLRAAVEIREAEQEEALRAYEATVLQALQEIETVLVQVDRENIRLLQLEKLVGENQKSFDLASKLYNAGLADYLRVLQSQVALLNSEEQLVLSKREILLRQIALFKALGGGWEEQRS